MNLCILLGKIVSEIQFKFIIKSKNKSIAYFDMELLNKSIIKIKSYDNMADFVYRRLNTGQSVIIEGKIREDGSIECRSIKVNRKSCNFM